MRLKNWKNLFFCILLASSGGSWCCIRVDASESANTDIWHSKNLASTQVNYQLCQNLEQEVINSWCKQSSELHPLNSQMPLKVVQQTPETTQAPDTTKEPGDIQKQNDSPQLESQPSNLPTAPPDSTEQLLNPPEINQSQRLEKLMQLLRSPKKPPESDSDRELGLRVRLRPLEQPTFPWMQCEREAT